MSDFTRYSLEALRTAGPLTTQRDQLICGALGLTGEAGETADHVKKHLFQGHELDRDKVVKELGDVLWYLALLARAVDSSLDEVAAANLAKLRARYPDGFDPERSINRAPTESPPPNREGLAAAAMISPVDVGVGVGEEAYFDGQGSAVRGKS